MTAKESLRQLVDDLSEEEASAWLERMGTRPANVSDYEGATGRAPVHGMTDMDTVLALIDEWLADESGLDEVVLPQIEAALAASGGVRFREPADW